MRRLTGRRKSFRKSFGIGVTLSGVPSITQVRVSGWKLSPIKFQPGIFHAFGTASLFVHHCRCFHSACTYSEKTAKSRRE